MRERQSAAPRRARKKNSKNNKKCVLQQQQGFNAVRLPFRFRDVAPGRVPYNYTRLCGVPSQDDAKASSVVPPAASRPTLLPAATREAPGSKTGPSAAAAASSSVRVPLRLPSQDFPDIPMFGASDKGICNAAMPQLDARERFLWNVELLIKQVKEFFFPRKFFWGGRTLFSSNEDPKARNAHWATSCASV